MYLLISIDGSHSYLMIQWFKVKQAKCVLRFINRTCCAWWPLGKEWVFKAKYDSTRKETWFYKRKNTPLQQEYCEGWKVSLLIFQVLVAPLGTLHVMVSSLITGISPTFSNWKNSHGGNNQDVSRTSLLAAFSFSPCLQKDNELEQCYHIYRIDFIIN
jgi:hypothetical protein